MDIVVYMLLAGVITWTLVTSFIDHYFDRKMELIEHMVENERGQNGFEE
jgi:hypothetical protein